MAVPRTVPDKPFKRADKLKDACAQPLSINEGESLVKPRIGKRDTILGGEAELRHTLSKRQAYFTAVRKHTFLYEAFEIFYSVHIQAF